MLAIMVNTFILTTGPLKSRMQFKGREVIVWSFNDYLGL